MQTATNLRVDIGSHDNKVVFYLLPVQVFAQEKIASIHLADFSSCRFKNDTGGGKVLKRLVSNDGSFCSTHCNIAYVSTGASHVANFTGECGAITVVKSGESEKKALVVNIFLIRYVDFLFSQKSFFVRPVHEIDRRLPAYKMHRKWARNSR